MIDVKTRWVELYGLLNRSQATVSAAIVACRGRLPYALLGLDLDNGSEFINDDLKRYCEQEHITFTRCCTYKKNDQAYVEQKNWNAVRQNVGYDRYEGPAACAPLNALYGEMPGNVGRSTFNTQRLHAPASTRSPTPRPRTRPARPRTPPA